MDPVVSPRRSIEPIMVVIPNDHCSAMVVIAPANTIARRTVMALVHDITMMGPIMPWGTVAIVMAVVAARRVPVMTVVTMSAMISRSVVSAAIMSVAAMAAPAILFAVIAPVILAMVTTVMTTPIVGKGGWGG